MKVFFTYQGIEKKFFYEFNVSSSLTVEEFIQFTQIKEIISKITSIPFALLKKSIMIGYPFSYHSKPKNQ